MELGAGGGGRVGGGGRGGRGTGHVLAGRGMASEL